MRIDGKGTAELQSSQTYHHGDLPNALLSAVADIVEENGVANVSLREAARRAGVSHSAPAHHFGDKEGMLAAFAERGFEILRDEMATARDATAGTPALDRLGAIGTAYVRFALDRTPYFDVMFRSGIDKPSHQQVHDSSDSALAVLIGGVEDLISEGGYAGVDFRHMTVYFWSLAHGLASLAVDESMPPDLDDVRIEEYIKGVFGMTQGILGKG